MMPGNQLLQLQRGWTPPQGLEHSRPRDVSLTASGWALAAVSAALVVAGLAAGIGLYLTAARQQNERVGLREHGVDTDAVVTRLWIANGRESRRWVAFEFAAGDRHFDGRLEVSRRTWGTLHEGSRIPVRYDPSNPAEYAAFGRDKKALGTWVAYVVGLALAACGWLATLRIGAQRRLLMEGRPAPGVVTTRRRVHHPHGGSHHEFQYEFLLLNGAAHTGGSTGSKPQVGDPISVLYEPDNPGRSAPYPLRLVRPARH